jgi:hypothetical protein
MPRVKLTIKDLAARRRRIRELLTPLVDSPRTLFFQPKSKSGDYIIGTHEGSRPTSFYGDWRFRTIVPELRGMYYEWWKRSEEDKEEWWYLYRAYLHIYKLDRAKRQESEYLLLHCDPSEPDGSPRAKYKQGPHLHIHAVNDPRDPFPRAHVALNAGHLDAVLANADSLTSAIKMAVNMLREEVLERLLT